MLAVFVILGVAGCSKDKGTGPEPENNTPPTVTFLYDKLAAIRSTDVTLAVDTDDADGDAVTVQWAVSRGLLTTNSQPNQIIWSTPSTTGSDTLTITASDGKASTTITEVVLVGTQAVNDITTAGVRWTRVNSPYIVAPSTDKFSVQSGASLTIEAGVRVLIEKSSSSISVEGRLYSTGTSAQQVIITPNKRKPTLGFWQGIVGTPDGPPPLIDLDYTWVTYGETAVRSLIATRTILDHCTIKFCSEPAVFHQSSGALMIQNCVLVSNQKSGIRVESSSQLPDTLLARGDSIAVNGRFSESTVYGNGEAGISISLDDPGGTVFIDISGNEISRNDFPGIRLKTAVYPVIRSNGIFGNELRKLSGKVNLELLEPFAGGAVDATRNWWGQDYAPGDSAAVKQGIIDADDNSQIGAHVYVTPWLGVWP